MKSNTITFDNSFKTLRSAFKDDLLAGFTVSLIALPLSLGIAIGSGFPPLAGLITAIIGGIVASRFSGSFVTISGPAAGLIVINLGAIERLGVPGDPSSGYVYALAAIVVAGIIMFLFGLFKVGKFGDFFPLSVIHGMLAAIGVIIIIKQSFYALGVTPSKGDLIAVAEQIPNAILHLNPQIASITVVSLLILIFHPKVKSKFIRVIPAPMWVLIASIPMAHLFNFFTPHSYFVAGSEFLVGPQNLVDLPESILDGITFPDFGKFATSAFWVSVISLSLVASIESLLSAKAVDTLDPHKRKSDLNKDMSAMGIGTAVSGLIGGLPMISEIVRSSANINNGAKSQWGNFFHGVFVLLYIALAASIIEQIPLAALASMLIFTGFRLASPKEFKHTYEVGPVQLLIFVVTLVTVVATDLLLGVAVGIATKLLIHIIRGADLSNVFKLRYQTASKGEDFQITLSGAVIFTNYLKLKKIVLAQKDTKRIVLNFEDCHMIDHTVMKNLDELRQDLERNSMKLVLMGIENIPPVSSHPYAARVKGKGGVGTFSPRQQMVFDFASQEGWEFTPMQLHKLDAWLEFDLTKGRRVRSVNNRLTRYEEGELIIIADLKLEEGAMLTLNETQITVLKLNTVEKVPVFTLEKEQLFDKFMAKAGWSDINFSTHPKFSNTYLLKGPDENAIRGFFTGALIEYLIEHKGYHVESNGEKLIIYKEGKILSIDGIRDLYDFARGFYALIPGHKKNLETI